MPGETRRIPPQAYFAVSAVFHYLGPSLAVLLFARLGVPGVAWLRLASAAAVFAAWRRPWRAYRELSRADRGPLLALGLVLAVMNTMFYLAVGRLPLSTVGAIEFLGTVILAAAGARTRRNAAALALTTAGVTAVTAIRLAGQPLGFAFAFANCALFMLYVVLGHRIANAAGPGGIDRLGAAVGVCSSVIPYVTDQLAMARLPRATFSLMLALLPAFAVVTGAIVLRQFPTAQDVAGIVLVVLGVAIHQEKHEKRQKGHDRGLREAGLVRAEGLPDLPGHDELRQPGRAGLAPRRGRGRADRQGGGRRRHHVLRHGRHLLRRRERGDH